jgi:hypothetical protein
MKRYIAGPAAAAVLSAALVTSWAWAQVDTTETRINMMQVDIWPEYDDPRVLLIYRGQLEPGREIPRDFAFVIPPGAQVHMAGAIGDNGEHLHSVYETRSRPDGLVELAYQPPTRTVYMEFYYDPLGDGEEREFQYTLVSPLPVAMWMVNVQQPLQARGLRMGRQGYLRSR